MQSTDGEPQTELIPEPSFVVENGQIRTEYRLKEVYRSISPQDQCRGTNKCIGSESEPQEPPKYTAYPGTPSSAATPTFSEIPTLLEGVLRAHNTTGGVPPVIQYNTYNIYQSDAQPISPPKEIKVEPQHVDKLIFTFILILLFVIVSFSAIIFILLVKFAKKEKRSKKADEKSMTEFDKYYEESQTISTSEIGFLPRRSLTIAEKSSRSAASRNVGRSSDFNFFASKKKENSGKSKKSNQSHGKKLLVKPEFRKEDVDSLLSPSLGKMSTQVSDSPTGVLMCRLGQELGLSEQVSHVDLTDFGQHIKSSFGEKVTSAIPEFGKGLEHSRSFLTSPDLPDYENGRFRNNFYAIKEIGKGSFGSVYRAFHKLEEKVYAIKCIEFSIPDGHDPRMDSTLREIYAMSDLKHDNVVRYITCWMEKEENEESESEPEKVIKKRGFGKKAACSQEVLWEEPQLLSMPDFQPIMEKQGSGFEIEFGCLPGEDKGKQGQGLGAGGEGESSGSEQGDHQPAKMMIIYLYIQMEFCKGLSLSACLDTDQFHLTPIDIYCIFSQVVDGLAYIHSKGLIHRDIKPGNIFVETTGMLKIGDFGLVMHHNQVVTVASMDMVTTSQVHLKKKFDKTRQPEGDETEFAGSPLYAPPEASDGEPICDPSGDVYATGIVLFELLGQFRTRHKKIQEIMALKKAKRTCDSFRQRHPFESRVIDMLIAHEPTKRPKAENIKLREEYRNWTAQIQIQAQATTKISS